jgi:Fe2+ transport system protein FeoA
VIKTLRELSTGESARTVGFYDPYTENLLKKFGLFVGENVKCVARANMMVIEFNLMTVALAKTLASKVFIK